MDKKPKTRAKSYLARVVWLSDCTHCSTSTMSVSNDPCNPRIRSTANGSFLALQPVKYLFMGKEDA